MANACNLLPSGKKGLKDDKENELLQHEAEGIKVIEIRMDVVRSMERLYAVPSEKLRVWSVWLTKVGEIADEWQRWLRAHIDLIVRLSDHLQAAEEAIRQAQEGEDKSQQSLSGEQGEKKSLATVGDSVREDGEVVETLDGREDAAVETEEQAESTEEEEIIEQSSEEAGDVGDLEGEEDDPQAASETSVTQEQHGNLMTWPIGRPWQHLGLIDKLKEEEFEKLSMPRNEEEMRQLVQKFTQEATIFRSYYKHWTETADQAVKEIGGRLVMATYITQGKGKRESERLSLESSRYFSALSGLGAPGAESKGSVTLPTDPAEEKSVKSAESDAFVTPDVSKSDAPTVIENVPDSMSAKTATSTATGKQQAKVKPSEETLVVDDLLKDCARASEPIPYLFYLKTEPDIDIAIEHDDEAVIPVDLERESILGNYKRLFYNLEDKPCKGGKPWL
ncbi:uncharacterized protein LOC143184052 isoform X2 [Calliopsis andreniformis]|uniref:uncharacterized protein LOC143184052 isoform X2 n=1 Tax=Calliopsis andreniformis TaxID=337506 RepID=UPI003FCCCF32